MIDETVHKGYHRAWQSHYHIVFSVKYLKALLGRDVTTIIMETAESASIATEYTFKRLLI